MADMTGLSVEEAKKQIEENLVENETALESLAPAPMAQPGQPGQQQGGRKFGDFINGSRKSPQSPAGKGGPQPKAGKTEPGSRKETGKK